MTGKNWQRTLIRILGVVIAMGLLLGVKVAFADKPEKTMLVWAGDKAHKAADFIAVVDFDSNSPKYGKVLRTVPLTGRSFKDNEPHHVGISQPDCSASR